MLNNYQEMYKSANTQINFLNRQVAKNNKQLEAAHALLEACKEAREFIIGMQDNSTLARKLDAAIELAWEARVR